MRTSLRCPCAHVSPRWPCNLVLRQQLAAPPLRSIVLAATQQADVTSVDGLRSLRVVDLKAKLQELGLPRSGLKEELVQRLHTAVQAQQLTTSQQTQQAVTSEADGGAARTQKPSATRKIRLAPAVAPVQERIADSAQELSSNPQSTMARVPQPQRLNPEAVARADRTRGGGDASPLRAASAAPMPLSTAPAGPLLSHSASRERPRQRPLEGPRPDRLLSLRQHRDQRQQQGPDAEGWAARRSSNAFASTSYPSRQTSQSTLPPRPRAVRPVREAKGLPPGPPPRLAPAMAANMSGLADHTAHPVSGHPQSPKDMSWAGHRPPRYWSVGSASSTPFSDALGGPSTVSNPDSKFPIVVGEWGQFVELHSTPVADWEAQPLPEDMPPFPPGYRKESYGSHELDMSPADKETLVISNPTGLNLSFLGTSYSQATHHRALPSVALNRAKDLIMFDAGDDTQRQVTLLPHVRLVKLFRIFVTCLSPDCIMGLPGLLCCISSSREKGHEAADIPIHLYGPPGLTDFVNTVLKVSNTYVEMTIVVHEFTMVAVPPEQREPVLVNPRARLWSVLLPPDQLNPDGYINGDLASFMPTQGRATIAKGVSAKGGVLASDPRANFLPFKDPVPGDASRTDVAPLDMSWSIRMDCEGVITALPLQAMQPTLGYILREADRAGNLLLERAQALGVPKGAAFGMLKEGKSIVTPGGTLVTPEMVVTPPRLGRKVAVLGTCSSITNLLRQPEASCLDVLVAGCVYPDAGAAAKGELLTAGALGEVAAQLSARHVLLSRFDWRLHGQDAHPYDDPVLGRLVEQTASKLSPHQRVTAVHDLWIHVVDKHEGVVFPPVGPQDQALSAA